MSRINKASIPGGIRAKVFRRDSWRCARCSEASRTMLEPHHIIPVCDGGQDNEENLVTLCRRCHDVVEALDLRTRPLIENWPIPGVSDSLGVQDLETDDEIDAMVDNKLPTPAIEVTIVKIGDIHQGFKCGVCRSDTGKQRSCEAMGDRTQHVWLCESCYAEYQRGRRNFMLAVKPDNWQRRVYGGCRSAQVLDEPEAQEAEHA